MTPPSHSSNATSGAQNRTSFGNSSALPEDIVCGCNIEAKMFTVRKEGPNTGIIKLLFNLFIATVFLQII